MADKSLHEILFGPDPAEPHRQRLADLLNLDLERWRDVINHMAAGIRDAAFKNRRGGTRRDVREGLKKIADLARELDALCFAFEIRSVWQDFPALSEKHADARAAMLGLLDLEKFAYAAAQLVPSGQGGDRAAMSRGHPTEQLLCAACIVELWTRVKNSPPGEGNAKAQEACEALFQAAGQPASKGEDHIAKWRRPLQDVRHPEEGSDGRAMRIRNARRYARSCLKLAQQE